MTVTVLNNVELTNRLNQLRKVCRINTILRVDDIHEVSVLGKVRKMLFYERNYTEKIKDYEKRGHDIIATLPGEKAKYYTNIPVIVFIPFKDLGSGNITEIVEFVNSQPNELTLRNVDDTMSSLICIINTLEGLKLRITEMEKLKATLEFKFEILPDAYEVYTSYILEEESVLKNDKKLPKNQLHNLERQFLKLSDELKKLVLKNVSKEKISTHFERCQEITKLESGLYKEYADAMDVYNLYNLSEKKHEFKLESIEEVLKDCENILSNLIQYEKDLDVLGNDKSLKGFIQKLVTDRIIQINEEPIN